MAVTTESTSARARAAARTLATLGRGAKDAALEQIALALERETTAIVEANAEDLAAARAAGQSSALVDRLTLDAGRVLELCSAVRAIAALDDQPSATSSPAWGPTGRVIGAEEALAAGYLHDAVRADAAERRALDLAASLGDVRVLKRMFSDLDGTAARVALENELLLDFQRSGAGCLRTRVRMKMTTRMTMTSPTIPRPRAATGVRAVRRA